MLIHTQIRSLVLHKIQQHCFIALDGDRLLVDKIADIQYLRRRVAVINEIL